VGMPGVAGVRQIGRFHAGGPIPSNPDFLLTTAPGRVLDPTRLLVSVASNLGATPGHPAHRPGTVLSIDPARAAAGTPIIVPNNIAASGAQRSRHDGALQVYSAQARAFLNSRHNSSAKTAAAASVSGPRYISVNNGFGRPWFANAPLGATGPGSVTVTDPNGAPLDHAPSAVAGGVFFGSETNRATVPISRPSTWIGKYFNYRAGPQLTPGALSHGVLGTAFLGPSPDGSGFAVFAAVLADGSVTQVHVQDGVDGLAPMGTVEPRLSPDDDGVIGIAFKWNPDRVLYIADAGRNSLLLLHLEDDGRQFLVARQETIAQPFFNEPIDIAAAVPEIANPHFSSHTTLAGGSDLYVANRGDGSIVRIDQAGRLIGRASIDLPGVGRIGAGRIRALAVSADRQKIWLTLAGEHPQFAGHDGMLIEVSGFDGSGAFGSQMVEPQRGTAVADLVSRGEQFFRKTFTPEAGLGPLFNAPSCVTCHPGPGGMSANELHFAVRVARMDPATGRVSTIEHINSPVARRHSTRSLGRLDAPVANIPHEANVVSLRMPISLYESALFDEIPDSEIEAQAVSKGDGIKGRAHIVTTIDGQRRVGRYGWKAQIATLDEMVADAFATEIGVTTPLASSGRNPAMPTTADTDLVLAVSAYLRALAKVEARP
jgi:hypothetical protein